MLAGGRSSRFGSQKADAMFLGEPIAARVARAVRAACGAGLFVVGGEASRAADLGATFVEDRFPGEGPLGALVTALEAIDAPFALLTACDMPLLTDALVCAVVEEVTRGEGEVVVPFGSAGDEPLCAVYARSVLAPARDAFERGERRMDSFHGAVRVRRVPLSALPDAYGLASVNTTDDLRRAEEVARAHRPKKLHERGRDVAASATTTPASVAARQLAARVAPLADEDMRRAIVRETLSSMDASSAADLLEALLTPDAPREAATSAAATACIAVFAGGETLPYDLVAELYEVATRRGYEAVRRLLLKPGARRVPTDGELGPDPRLGDRPLGERKWLARKADPELIDRLLFDPDPAVLENLLANPRMTEREALRIAAHRPGAPDVLRLLAKDRRFGKRERVRRALVRNPYTPVEVATNLLALLPDRDLREVSQDGTLHPQVREAAGSVFRSRQERRTRAR
jgi:molybdopterin-guanine dinucleotide biosynthesis protein A